MNNKKNILVADDDPDMTWVLKDFLLEEGFHAVLANNGKEAVDLIRSNYNFDLIILDVAMPIMNGIEALTEIKKLKPSSKVLMITAFRDEDIVREAADKGSLGCIYKPFDLSYLRKVITEAINS